MNREEQIIYKTCMENGCTKKQAKAISQVYNSERTRERKRKKQMQGRISGFVPLSVFPEDGEDSEKGIVISKAPGPEELLIRKEEIHILMDLISILPEKHQSFIETAFRNDCIGIFEETKADKYRDMEKMSHILEVSPRTVRRHVIRIKKLLYELGKDLLSDANF